MVSPEYGCTACSAVWSHNYFHSRLAGIENYLHPHTNHWGINHQIRRLKWRNRKPQSIKPGYKVQIAGTTWHVESVSKMKNDVGLTEYVLTVTSVVPELGRQYYPFDSTDDIWSAIP